MKLAHVPKCDTCNVYGLLRVWNSTLGDYQVPTYCTCPRGQAARSDDQTQGRPTDNLSPTDTANRHTRLMAACIDRELRTMSKPAGPKLYAMWETQYGPIIAGELDTHGEQRDEILIERCVALRNNRTPIAVERESCRTCRGTGEWSPEWGTHEPCPACTPTTANAGEMTRTLAARYSISPETTRSNK